MKYNGYLLVASIFSLLLGLVGCYKHECPLPDEENTLAKDNVIEITPKTFTLVFSGNNQMQSGSINSLTPNSVGVPVNLMGETWTASGNIRYVIAFFEFFIPENMQQYKVDSAQLLLFADTTTFYSGSTNKGHVQQGVTNDWELYPIYDTLSFSNLTWNSGVNKLKETPISFEKTISNSQGYQIDVLPHFQNWNKGGNFNIAWAINVKTSLPYARVIFYNEETPYAALRPQLKLRFSERN